MTGRLALSSAGVHTFSVRQSSPTGRLSRTPQMSASSGRRVPAPACGERPAHAIASRTPVHDAGLPGGRKRLAPAVEAP